MLFYHKGLGVRKTPLPLVAGTRKAVILRGQIWSAHESDVVGLGRMGLEVQRVVRRRHVALEVQRIMPKAIHMGGEVRAQTGQDVLVYGVALLD
jgi:hypothetical protein